jgi:hypothetical protein
VLENVQYRHQKFLTLLRYDLLRLVSKDATSPSLFRLEQEAILPSASLLRAARLPSGSQMLLHLTEFQ